MGVAAAPLSLAATGLSAFSSYASGRTAGSNARRAGRQQQAEAFLSAEQLRTAAAAADLRATETDRYMRERQLGTLGNIDAVLALTGKTDDSPSSWAVRNRFEYQSDEARATAVENLRSEARQKRNAATLYALSGINAMKAADENARDLELSGLLGGVGRVFKAIPGINMDY